MASNGEILTAITNLSTALNSRIDTMSMNLHKRMDDLGQDPERPCPDLSGHLSDHKAIQKTWVGELVRGLIAVIVILGTAGIIYAVGWK